MWQYWLLMTLIVLATFSGIRDHGKPTKSSYITNGQAITHIIVASLMTWLIWSFLSVNWMWLSIGLMAIMILNCARIILQAVITRRTQARSGYGVIITIAYGIAYTVFYLKFVQ